MNKRHLSVFTLGLVMLAASCKKNDALYQPPTKAEAAQTATTAAAPAEWKSISNWNSSPQDKFTVFSTQIKDSAVSSAVISKGLVLVYLNTGSGVVSLPHQQKDGGDAFWYHQLSKNTLQINVDAYTAGVKPDASQVKYFVVTPQQLQQLQQSGYDKKSLLSLPYEKAASLLK